MEPITLGWILTRLAWMALGASILAFLLALWLDSPGRETLTATTYRIGDRGDLERASRRVWSMRAGKPSIQQERDELSTDADPYVADLVGRNTPSARC